MKEVTGVVVNAALEFKCEDETETGMPMGTLTEVSGGPVFPDGRWVTKATALRIARQRGVELLEN